MQSNCYTFIISETYIILNTIITMTIYLDKSTIETNISFQYLCKLVADNISNESLLTTRNENKISFIATKLTVVSKANYGKRVAEANQFYNIGINIDYTKIRRIDL